jgi:hypothetical protein
MKNFFDNIFKKIGNIPKTLTKEQIHELQKKTSCNYFLKKR